MSRNIYFSNKTPHLTHEAIYYNDTSFEAGGGLKDNVKIAYDLAVEKGFEGSVQDNLQGIIPYIGQDGKQFIDEKNIDISASGEFSSEKIDLISEGDIDNYFNQKNENISFQNEENALNSSDIDNLFN